ncbi:predicted protein [Verticillium alfalfae VaMs.102]|uniref:Predicted protein n=1 Tax=Verticillium alfalfae (strain VaMs.102 / ATCC MYA-4576 / FGSC 10136) TaxID=526221 RepID=C9SD49_VERA1|nr:predicted protein [Verticillium alfalfae VaMs.102]EEY17014.1 predicted protein [Verticillium alfalfae VaMs.102]
MAIPTSKKALPALIRTPNARERAAVLIGPISLDRSKRSGFGASPAPSSSLFSRCNSSPTWALAACALRFAHSRFSRKGFTARRDRSVRAMKARGCSCRQRRLMPGLDTEVLRREKLRREKSKGVPVSRNADRAIRSLDAVASHLRLLKGKKAQTRRVSSSGHEVYHPSSAFTSRSWQCGSCSCYTFPMPDERVVCCWPGPRLASRSERVPNAAMLREPKDEEFIGGIASFWGEA